jgi:hypothetical protein
MELKLEPRHGYLLATITGQLSLSEAIGGYKKACDFASNRGLNKILADCSAVKGQLSDLERYELGQTMAEYSLSRGKNAHVATIGQPPTINGFVAQVARNRGLNAETFSERKPALDWLNKFGSKAAGS